jgi:hypothetical protein
MMQLLHAIAAARLLVIGSNHKANHALVKAVQQAGLTVRLRVLDFELVLPQLVDAA